VCGRYVHHQPKCVELESTNLFNLCTVEYVIAVLYFFGEKSESNIQLYYTTHPLSKANQRRGSQLNADTTWRDQATCGVRKCDISLIFQGVFAELMAVVSR
jgi:hypothetical protein